MIFILSRIITRLWHIFLSIISAVLLNVSSSTIYSRRSNFIQEAPALVLFSFYYRRFLTTFLFFFNNSLSNINFLPLFYARNNLLWADGFLIDFLQKKSVDLLTRKFFLFTGFLFSERFIFELVLKLYLDTLVWPLHAVSIFEVANTIELLSSLLAFYFLFFSFLVALLLIV